MILFLTTPGGKKIWRKKSDKCLSAVHSSKQIVFPWYGEKSFARKNAQISFSVVFVKSVLFFAFWETTVRSLKNIHIFSILVAWKFRDMGIAGIIPRYMQECSGYEVPGRDLVWAWADRPLDGDDPGRGHRPLGGQGRAGRDVSNQFKGTVPRDFWLHIFSWSVSPKPLSTPLVPFRSSSVRKGFIILFGNLCYFQRLGGRWFMKKTWSKNSRGTVPLNVAIFPLVYLPNKKFNRKNYTSTLNSTK
jgi:hypothetical protein